MYRLCVLTLSWFGSAIYCAITKYEDNLGESIDSEEERASGYYAQDDDDINRSSAYYDGWMTKIRYKKYRFRGFLKKVYPRTEARG